MFADWLLERGDARGEALALELAGRHRTLRALRRAHQAQWLAPWLPHLDLARCAFFGPFPTRLSFLPGVPPEALDGLPPTLRHLGADWRVLAALAGRPMRLEVLEATVTLVTAPSDFRALAAELDRLCELPGPTLHLRLDGFLGVEAANLLADGLLRSALARRDAVALVVREGPLDAACAWLQRAPSWGAGARWGARWGGAQLDAVRDEYDRFRVLEADLTFDDEKPIAARLASAAAMLSQLGRLSPTRIDVHLGEGVRAGKKAGELLEAARRRLPQRPLVRVVRKKSLRAAQVE